MDDHGATEARSQVPRQGASSWLALLGWLALVAVAGAVGALASRNSSEFYDVVTTPAWAPPGWLFGPVWTALYILMGIAAWLVWREQPALPEGRSHRQRGLVLFVGQLVLNALWTWLFFAWRDGAAAFAEIIVLWLAIVLTMWYFGRVRPLAAYLLVPYLAWVTFAAALTWAVWQRNPGLL